MGYRLGLNGHAADSNQVVKYCLAFQLPVSACTQLCLFHAQQPGFPYNQQTRDMNSMQGLQFAQAVIFGQTVGNLMELSLPKVPNSIRALSSIICE